MRVSRDHRLQVADRDHGADVVERVVVTVRVEHLELGVVGRVADGDPHEETVELALR